MYFIIKKYVFHTDKKMVFYIDKKCPRQTVIMAKLRMNATFWCVFSSPALKKKGSPPSMIGASQPIGRSLRNASATGEEFIDETRFFVPVFASRCKFYCYLDLQRFASVFEFIQENIIILSLQFAK